MKLAYPYLSRPRMPARSLAAVLVTTLALSACHHEAPAVDVTRDVVVLPAQAADAATTVVLNGDVQTRFVTPMSFRVAGKLIERRVHLGDIVRKGEVVARLDPADADQNAASAQADLASAREHFYAAAKQLQRDVAQASNKLISALQLEQTQDSYAAAQSQLSAAEARLALAGNQRHYTNLLAEHDGVISAEQANTGEVVAAGAPVFSLAWSGATDISTDAAEKQVGLIRVGDVAVIKMAAIPGRQFSGRVREVSPAADPQSRTYRVKVTLDAPDAEMRLGMSATVAIITGGDSKSAARAVIIPATALFHQGSEAAVWVVRGGDKRLELRPVTVDAYGERSVTISAGLKAGEQIVVQGVHTLTAGDAVKPVAPLHAEDFVL